uniref:Uncharacterized protein n=1 Tax=Lactuca sativa TaxID=4236 RepID=A0A9R1X6E1_LACSA|nr:hypothetical protein LSAT_V11C600307270 [Lactuca sativa]
MEDDFLPPSVHQDRHHPAKLCKRESTKLFHNSKIKFPLVLNKVKSSRVRTSTLHSTHGELKRVSSRRKNGFKNHRLFFYADLYTPLSSKKSTDFQGVLVEIDCIFFPILAHSNV